MNNIIGYIATTLGLVLVVIGWFIWGDRSQPDMFTLNIIVSVVAYCVMFVDVLIPWADLRDKTQRRIGNSGIRWFVQYGYSITAILLLVLCNILDLAFITSLFLQGVLLFLFLLGIASSIVTAKKIQEVSQENDMYIDCLQLMRDEFDAVLQAAYDAPAPQFVIDKLNHINDSLRFISPSNSERSRKMENEIIEQLASLRPMFSNCDINIDQIVSGIEKAERLIQKRKNTYSN